MDRAKIQQMISFSLRGFLQHISNEIRNGQLQEVNELGKMRQERNMKKEGG